MTSTTTADIRVQEAKERALRVLARWAAGLGKVHMNPVDIVSASDLLAANDAIKFAEAERAALDKPRLRTAAECYDTAWRNAVPIVSSMDVFCSGVRARDSEWMEKIEKLASRHAGPRLGEDPRDSGLVVKMTDLRALYESAK